MNQLKHALLLLCLVTLGAIGLSSCTEPEKPTTKTTIALDQTAKELKVGDTFTLKAKLTPSNAKEQITWSSSKSDVATVDNGGKVTAKAAGEAIITATLANGNKATCNVKVTKMEEPQKPDTPKEKTAITLDKSKHELKVGETFTLKATLAPENAKDKISWSSSNVEVATVNDKGEVTAKGEGEATITAALENGNNATCTLTVKKKDAPAPAPTPKKATIKFKKDKYVIAVDATIDLSKEVVVTKGSDPNEELTILWSNDDDDTAELDDETGVVTGVTEGEVTITAELLSGESATCKVVVGKKDDNTGGGSGHGGGGISFNPYRIQIEVGETAKIPVVYGSVNKAEVSFKSENEKVAIVTEDGQVKGIAPGSVQVRALLNGAQLHASLTVNVIPKVEANRYTYKIYHIKKKNYDVLSKEEVKGEKGKKVIKDYFKKPGMPDDCIIALEITDTKENKVVETEYVGEWKLEQIGNETPNGSSGFQGNVSWWAPTQFNLHIKVQRYAIDEVVKFVVEQYKANSGGGSGVGIDYE